MDFFSDASLFFFFQGLKRRNNIRFLHGDPTATHQVKKGKVDRSIFDGSTINTPSMLCVEDYIDALQWCDTVGGLGGLIKRSEVGRG